jgi:glucokinase
VLLAGDIGGTKTDLAVYSAEEGPLKPLHAAEYPSQDYESLAAMLQRFRGETDLQFDHACFGVAGPVLNGKADLTNLDWDLDDASLSSQLGMPVHLMNDLQATALGIPLLRPDDLRVLNAGKPQDRGSIAVIAPGTGLGEAFLTWDNDHYEAHASEGGHTDFAPTDELQLELLRWMLARHDHVSYELVCSGIGIPSVYEFLRARSGADELPGLAGEPDPPDRTRLIIDAALAKARDRTSSETLEVFAAILGAEAGNLALKTLATGGVYLAGGIPKATAALLQQNFMASFRRKGRFSKMLESIPVHIVLVDAALIGAASFGLDGIITSPN